MADDTLQYEWIVTLKGGVEALFKDREDVFVAGDLFWYPIEGDNKTRVAPDLLVAFGRPKGHRGSYMQWVEGCIAPQVVFEVVSPSSGPRDYIMKAFYYNRHGVEEYYIYDPDHAALTAFHRVNGELEEIEFKDRLQSPRLGVTFDLTQGEMQVWRPDGKRFLTFAEYFEIGEMEEKRAQIAEQRADLAEQRAAKLAALLREAGIDPDAADHHC